MNLALEDDNVGNGLLKFLNVATANPSSLIIGGKIQAGFNRNLSPYYNNDYVLWSINNYLFTVNYWVM